MKARRKTNPTLKHAAAGKQGVLGNARSLNFAGRILPSRLRQHNPPIHL